MREYTCVSKRVDPILPVLLFFFFPLKMKGGGVFWGKYIIEKKRIKTAALRNGLPRKKLHFFF